MQAVRDAGILLVAFTLLISVRITPVEAIPGDEALAGFVAPHAVASEQERAAPLLLPVAILDTVSVSPGQIHRILSRDLRLEIAGSEVETVERCTQVLLRVRRLIEAGRSEPAIVFEAKSVVNGASCPSA